ncbi:serine/threonine protein kinase [Sediminibacillus massiliensis]|uniref:serine/threonine protein kinase n=1 Tax=Sediminibacillus massiliensis TaxID=1926277 RepID=UPI00098874C3|nr:serine/threonine protein kinase [Sediminibacillus massiliensis]
MDKSRNWEAAIEGMSQIVIHANPHNEPVTIEGSSDGWICIGVGTDAAVFRSIDFPDLAFKLYAEEKIAKKEIEQNVYKQLGENRFFPKFHGAGDRFLVLNYEEGTTLYDCLLQGIPIPPQVIEDVEAARDFIKSRDLNPRDIHLKNILLQGGHAKILDVSEYVNPGNDFRWEYLKRGYEEYYQYIEGRPIPFWLMNMTRKWYNQTSEQQFVFEDFMRKITKLTIFWRS